MTKTYRDGWANIDATAAPHEYVATMSRIRDTQPASQFATFLGLLDAQPGQQILDVACGQGHVAQVVARHIGAGRVGSTCRSSNIASRPSSQRRRREQHRRYLVRFYEVPGGEVPYGAGQASL